MGFNLNTNEYSITNSFGVVKFSTNNSMPHIIYNIPGVIRVPRVLEYEPTADYVNREDITVLITNTNIKENSSFILPYYKIRGGFFETGINIVSGPGSCMLRAIRQPSTGELLGSTIMTTLVEGNTLKIVFSQNLDRVEQIGAKNIIGDDILDISYRIYYGRFQ